MTRQTAADLFLLVWLGVMLGYIVTLWFGGLG